MEQIKLNPQQIEIENLLYAAQDDLDALVVSCDEFYNKLPTIEARGEFLEDFLTPWVQAIDNKLENMINRTFDAFEKQNYSSYMELRQFESVLRTIYRRLEEMVDDIILRGRAVLHG